MARAIAAAASIDALALARRAASLARRAINSAFCASAACLTTKRHAEALKIGGEEVEPLPLPHRRDLAFGESDVQAGCRQLWERFRGLVDPETPIGHACLLLVYYADVS
ncbi:MAG: hypothetical protein ACLP53_07595 [Isosphaeraceae bacterium]